MNKLYELKGLREEQIKEIEKVIINYNIFRKTNLKRKINKGINQYIPVHDQDKYLNLIKILLIKVLVVLIITRQGLKKPKSKNNRTLIQIIIDNKE